MKFERLQEGQTVYDVHSHRMGNTTIRTLGCWSIRIKQIDTEKRRVLASWNSNEPRWFYERDVKSWKKETPILVKTGFGAFRRPTREERKQLKEAKSA